MGRDLKICSCPGAGYTNKEYKSEAQDRSDAGIFLGSVNTIGCCKCSACVFGIMSKILTKSIWVYHFAAAPCNNCDIEILDVLTPKYDVERFGIKLVGSIRHADCMLLTGIVNTKDLPRLKAIYAQAPKPFFVIAIGTCPAGLGVIRGSYNSVGPAGEHIPVDVYVPGCPPKPEAIISGVIKLIQKALKGVPAKSDKETPGVKKL